MSCVKDNKNKPTQIDLENKQIETDSSALKEILTDVIIAIEENRIKDLDFIYIFQEIRRKCYEDNDDLAEQVAIIWDIISNLFKVFTMATLNLKRDLLKSLEFMMIIFILHFDRVLIDHGITILKFLLNVCDTDYHRECLKNLTGLIQIFRSKKGSMNTQTYEGIISNLSTAVIVLIYMTDIEVRKSFFQFVTTNFDDYMLIYCICLNCSSDVRFYKFYSTENIITLTDKYMKELDRHCKIIESLVKNYDKTVNTGNKIKSFFEIVGQMCKVLDAFLNSNNRTYNYDKLIKSILVSLRSMWSVLASVDISVSPS
jgi:hypothetical protein